MMTNTQVALNRVITEKPTSFKNLQKLVNLNFRDAQLLDYEIFLDKYEKFINECVKIKYPNIENFSLNIYLVKRFFNSELPLSFTNRNKLSECRIFFLNIYFNIFELESIETNYINNIIYKNNLKEIKLDTLTIIDIEYNEDLLGFILTLSDERIVQIQFEVETNKIHADYDKHYPEIDEINEYGLNLTDDEEEEIRDFIRHNAWMWQIAEELDYIREQEREEFYIKHREI